MEAQVKVDIEQLRKQYASMSDEGLLAIDPVELIPEAQVCLSEVITERGLAADEEAVALPGDEPEPEWLPDASCVCTFEARRGPETASQAAQACDALKAAGISCYIAPFEMHDPLSSFAAPHREYRVMVPGAKMLEATSILDQKLFNPEIADDWRVHLETLSDEDFDAIDPEVICAGFLDRAARLKHAYDDEHARRHPPDE
jgi:hypothetical protein